MYRTCAVAIAVIAGLGLLMWALVDPDVEGIPTRIRPYGEGAFLVFPKYRDNTYSLALQSGKGLHPYPSRHAHEKGLITNAVDIHLDSRGTLWVLDSGVVRTLGRPTRKSAPRVLALDADSGEIKRTVSLEGLVTGRAQFLEVEESISGPEKLYVSDGPSRCIAVWEVATGRGKRLILPRAVSHPSDVLYLALVPPSNLYFTYYKSPDMYVVDTRDHRGLVRKVGSKPPGVILIGREGRNILFRVSGSQTLYTWNTQRDLSRHTFKQRDSGGLGDPLHAVADIGRTWVLEADLSAFLSGKKVSHRIRAINHTYNCTDKEETSETTPELPSPVPTPTLPDESELSTPSEASSTNPTLDLAEVPKPTPAADSSDQLEPIVTTPTPPCCPSPQERCATTTPLPHGTPNPISSTNSTIFEKLPTTAAPEVVLRRPPSMLDDLFDTPTQAPTVSNKKLVPSPPI